MGLVQWHSSAHVRGRKSSVRKTYVSEYSFFTNPTPMPASGVWHPARALLWLTRTRTAQQRGQQDTRAAGRRLLPPSLRSADPKRDRLDAVKCSFLSVALPPSPIAIPSARRGGRGPTYSRRGERQRRRKLPCVRAVATGKGTRARSPSRYS